MSCTNGCYVFIATSDGPSVALAGLQAGFGAAVSVALWKLGAWQRRAEGTEQRLHEAASRLVDERFRGRVMSFYTMAFFGATPVGSLLGGILADRVGASTTILLGGVATLAVAGWFAVMLPTLRPLVRKIYVERVIIAAPDVDSGSASP